MSILRTFLPSALWLTPVTARPRAHRPVLADYPRTSLEKLRFADTDLNGHISHAVFAVCCQNARMELLRDHASMSLPVRTHFAIARLELDFLGELSWPSDVAIGTRIDRLGRRSFTVGQGLFVDGNCVGKAASVVVLIDAATRRALPLPAATRQALTALVMTPLVRPGFARAALKQRLGWAGHLV